MNQPGPPDGTRIFVRVFREKKLLNAVCDFLGGMPPFVEVLRYGKPIDAVLSSLGDRDQAKALKAIVWPFHHRYRQKTAALRHVLWLADVSELWREEQHVVMGHQLLARAREWLFGQHVPGDLTGECFGQVKVHDCLVATLPVLQSCRKRHSSEDSLHCKEGGMQAPVNTVRATRAGGMQ